MGTDNETPVVETQPEDVSIEASPAEVPSESVSQKEPFPITGSPYDLQTLLDQADSKYLRTHPKVAGIIGSEIQRSIAAERKKIQDEEGKKAARAAEEQLQQLAESDPVSFAEHWLTDAQRKKIESQLHELRGQTREEFAASIGKGYHELPEWSTLTADDHESLARTLIGKSDDELLPTFNVHALDLLANKRAQRLVDEWKAKELAKERDAIHQEEAAKLLTNTAAPDTSRAKGTPAKVNVQSMSDKEFDDYWEKVVKKG